MYVPPVWFKNVFGSKKQFISELNNGGTYLLIHFLGNFREKTKKVPTHSLFRKLSEISPKFPKKLEALLLVKQLGKGNFLDSRKFPEPYYYSHTLNLKLPLCHICGISVLKFVLRGGQIMPGCPPWI